MNNIITSGVSSGVTSSFPIATVRKGGLYWADNFEGITFQFNPETIMDSKITEFSKISVFGRSHPRVQWTSGGSRTVSFELYINTVGVSSSGLLLRSVDQSLSTLRAMQYPRRSADGKSNVIVPLIFIYGPEYSLRCLITNDSIEHKKFNANGESMESTIKIELEEYTNRSIVASDVGMKGYGHNYTIPTAAKLGEWIALALK